MGRDPIRHPIGSGRGLDSTGKTIQPASTSSTDDQPVLRVRSASPLPTISSTGRLHAPTGRNQQRRSGRGDRRVGVVVTNKSSPRATVPISATTREAHRGHWTTTTRIIVPRTPSPVTIEQPTPPTASPITFSTATPPATPTTTPTTKILRVSDAVAAGKIQP